MTFGDILLPGSDTANLFRPYICLCKIIITMNRNKNQNHQIMKTLIIISILLLGLFNNTGIRANHINQSFNINNLLERKDIVSSQSDNYYHENSELGNLNGQFYAKIDTTTDILHFFSSNGILNTINIPASTNTSIHLVCSDQSTFIWTDDFILIDNRKKYYITS